MSCLPALLVLAGTRRPTHLRGLLIWIGLLVLIGIGARSAGDPFAARRALIGFTAGLGLMISSASLGECGRRNLAKGLCLASASLLGDALAESFSGGDRLPLGNSGDLSEALVPGAVLALAAITHIPRPFRSLALLVAFGTMLFIATTPVLAGIVSLSGAAGVGWWSARGAAKPSRHWSLPLGIAALSTWIVLAIATVFHEPQVHLNQAGEDVAAEQGLNRATDASPTTGGIKVRALIWATLPAVIQAAPTMGHGPGQFRRIYPVHRNPEELALSSQGHTEPTPTEVEHAHNDWLQPFVDWGWVGGLAWVFLLTCAARGALALLASPSPSDRAIAAASFAVGINALFNSNILYGVASPAWAWPLLGVCLGGLRTPRPGHQRRITLRVGLLAPALVSLILIANIQGAFALYKHGRHLADVVNVPTTLVDGRLSQSPSAIQGPLSRALRSAPDSVVALEKYHQLQQAQGASADERRTSLGRILFARPHALGPLIDLAVLLAQEGNPAEAFTVFERAHRIDSRNATLRRNRLLLGIDAGRLEQVLAWTTELIQDNQATQAWLESGATTALMNGRIAVARALLSKGDQAWVLGEELLAESTQEGRRDTLLGEGFLAASNAAFARQLAHDKDWASALRLYRQALRPAEIYDDLPGGGSRLWLEYAAVLCLLDRVEEAESVLVDHNARQASYLRDLPEWAGQSLIDAGLFTQDG